MPDQVRSIQMSTRATGQPAPVRPTRHTALATLLCVALLLACGPSQAQALRRMGDKSPGGFLMNWKKRGSASVLEKASPSPSPKPKPPPATPNPLAPYVSVLRTAGAADVTRLTQTVADLKGVPLRSPAPRKPPVHPLLASLASQRDALKSKLYATKLGRKFAPSPPPPVKYDGLDLAKVLLTAKRQRLFPSKYPSPSLSPSPDLMMEKGKFKTMLDAGNFADSSYNESKPDINFNLKVFKGFRPKKTLVPVSVRLPVLPLLTKKKYKPIFIKTDLPLLPKFDMKLPDLMPKLDNPLSDVTGMDLFSDKPSLWPYNLRSSFLGP